MIAASALLYGAQFIFKSKENINEDSITMREQSFYIYLFYMLYTARHPSHDDDDDEFAHSYKSI